jgi:hypothetical protein
VGTEGGLVRQSTVVSGIEKGRGGLMGVVLCCGAPIKAAGALG